MRAIAFLLVLLVLSAGLGRALLVRLRTEPWTRLDQVLFSVALGLGVCGYGVFALGLVGALNATYLTLAAAVLGVPAVWGVRALSRSGSHASPALEDRCGLWLFRLFGSLLVAVGVTALVQCFVPPGAHEWDSLSYHLAAPRAFIEAGRIIELPTDHHSYFPFLTQMLFAAGLVFDGFAAAKLVHFAMGVLTVLTSFAVARRSLGERGGWIAALTVGLTPVVAWEAGVAYIDLAQALYVALGFHALLIYLETRTSQCAALCGAMCGLALGVKTLSLMPVTAFAASLMLSRARVRHLAPFASLLLVLGAPFYLRALVLTGNPVYPFAYSVFGGRYWDAHRARLYAGEHTSFGLDGSLPTVGEDLRAARRPHLPPSVADRVRNLVLAPFALVGVPRLFHNYNDPGPLMCIGFLAVALTPLSLLARRAPRPVVVCAGVAASWYVMWSLSMQYARYLIPMMPILAFLCAFGWVATSRKIRWFPWVGWAAVVLQGLVVLSQTVPRALSQAPVLWSPEAAERYLSRQVNVYAAQRWLNEHAGPHEGVVLYEETRGFYLRRPVLWGNSPHSTWIPYARFDDGRSMVRWFVGHGVRYALVNLQFSPQAASPEGAQRLRDAVASGSQAGLLLDWYREAGRYGEPWRTLLADAIGSGDATMVEEASVHGAAVLRFRDLPEDGR